jgi:hypothetical protein
MMGMMGAIGMGDWKMESAKPMSMGGGQGPSGEPAQAPALEEKRVGDLLVAVLPATDTAKVGPSAIRVRVRDADGAPLKQGNAVHTMDMPGMTTEHAGGQEDRDGLRRNGIVHDGRSRAWSSRSTAPASRRFAKSVVR